MPRDATTQETPISGSRRAFFRARARLAAYALHHKYPQIACEAGRRGGETTSRCYALGKQAWGVAMAMKRWHGTPFHYFASRAPAGPGGKGDGIPEPGPATALARPSLGRPKQRGEDPRQIRLL